MRYCGYREFSSDPLRRRQAPYDGCPLILGFGGPIRLAGPAGVSRPTSFLAGMHDAAVVTEFVGAQAGVEVQLTPLGVYALLGRPMSDLTNQCVPLDALEAPDIAELPHRIAEDVGWAARFARVDEVLLRRLQQSRVAPSPEIESAWCRLVASGGRVTVEQLASYTGWSRRHLLTRCQREIGLAPKALVRVVRFSRAAQRLVPMSGGAPPTTMTDVNIADLAAACGYADHSHLVRDFHALAGCTPTQYAAEWQAA